MGRDGDGDGAVGGAGIVIIAFTGWRVFLGESFGTAVRFISSHFLCFVLCFTSPPLR